MAKLEIYLVDTMTKVENHQTEDSKPGIFHDATNIKKEMDENEQNESDVKMENGLQNTNRQCEISAKQENLNGYKTEQGVEIKTENIQNQSEKEENQIDFSIPETIEAKIDSKEITSYICGNKSNFEENSSALDQVSKKYINVFPNVSIAMNSENEHFDVEGDVIKTELKVGNDSESETEAYKRISAEHEVLNDGKTAKNVETKCCNEKEENQIRFSPFKV